MSFPDVPTGGTVLVISGSPSPESPTEVLLATVTGRLAALGHEVHTLAVRDLPTLALLDGDLLDPTVRHAVELVDRAHGVVVATAVYRAAHCGPVQSLLNLLGKTALTGKTVFPLATGGAQGHLVAIDYALRPLLTARGATDVVPGQFVPDTEIQRDALSTGVSAELDAAVRRFAQAVADRRDLAPAS